VPLRLAIGLLSGAAIAYELLLMRLFSIVQWHHFAYMVISLALLGYGASGAVLTVFRRPLVERFETAFFSMAVLFSLSAVGCFAAAQRLHLNPLELVWSGRQWGVLAVVYLLLAVPFLCAGGAVGLALVRFRESIHRIYRADLLGAAAGAAGMIGLLYWLKPADCLRAVALAGSLAAVISLAGLTSRKGGTWRAGASALAIVAPFLWPSSWLEPRMSEYKPLAMTLATPGTEVVAERSSPLGSLAAVRSERIPFRIAPGLSFAFRGEIPEQVVVFDDGEVRAVIDRASGRSWNRQDPRLDYLDYLPLALPFHLLRAERSAARTRVALLGASGLALALRHGADEIHVIEGNPQFFDLVTGELAEFSGGLFQAPRVHLFPVDARGFLARSQPGFDLIILNAGEGGGASAARSLAATYAHTVEAFALFLDRLSDRGVLAVTGELLSPPRASLKLLATAAEALERSGRDPLRHVAVIRSWNRFLILVKTSVFTGVEIEAIRAFSEKRFFDLSYLPGMAETDANRFNLLDEPELFRGAQALLGRDRDRFIRDYKFQLEPATDDRPYFFQFFRWTALAELLELRARGGAALMDLGYVLLIAALLQAALAGLLLILLPLRLVRSRTQRSDQGTGRVGLYFLCLGLAFLFLEIALIERLTLFLARPLVAAAVVLAGFLFFAGLGSGASRRFERLAVARGRDPIRLAAAGIVLLAVGLALALPSLFAVAIAWPIAAKIALALGVIAPLAFLLGMPFPIGLRRVAAAREDLSPWAWGVNGWASVLSAVLATLLAVHWGFTIVIAGACGLYMVAAWSAPEASR